MHSFYGGYGEYNGWGMNPLWFFGIGGLGITIGLIIILIVIALKGYALWHAARRSEKKWFIALLVVNTMGILELIYLYFVVGKWHTFEDSGTPPVSTRTPPVSTRTPPVSTRTPTISTSTSPSPAPSPLSFPSAEDQYS